jgi:hypothetical protein
MNCDHIEPWISAYQDGELDARRRRSVEEHLEGCPACAVLLRELEQLTARLQESLTYEEAPETLHTRVMREIPEPQPALLTPGGFRPPRNWFSFGLVPIGALTALLLMGPRQAQTPVPGVGASGGGRTSSVPTMAVSGEDGRPISGSPSDGEQSITKAVGLPREPVKPSEPSQVKGRPKDSPASTPRTRGGKNRGEYRPDLGPLHELRRLRPRPKSYRLVRRENRDRRRPRRDLMVVNLSPSRSGPGETHEGGVGGPGARRPGSSGSEGRTDGAATRIAVVDYVLPEVQPEGGTASDPETRFVLRPADEPYQVSEAVYDY